MNDDAGEPVANGEGSVISDAGAAIGAAEDPDPRSDQQVAGNTFSNGGSNVSCDSR